MMTLEAIIPCSALGTRNFTHCAMSALQGRTMKSGLPRNNQDQKPEAWKTGRKRMSFGRHQLVGLAKLSTACPYAKGRTE